MTNLELAHTMKALATTYRTHYSLGGCLQLATEENKRIQLSRFDNGTVRRKQIEEALPNEYLGDCNCSIKSIVFWGFNFKDGGHPGSDKDFTTEEMIGRCRDVSTDFSHGEVGEILYKHGHLGVIVEILPDGRMIGAECNERWGKEGMMLTACNCQIDGYDTQEWEKHGKMPEITFESEVRTLKQIVTERLLCKKGDKGEYVKAIQQRLVDLGYSVGASGVDGDFGNATEKAVIDFQSDCKKVGIRIGVDGIVGYDTIKMLLIE